MAPLAGRRALKGRALRGLAEGRRGLCRAQPVTIVVPRLNLRLIARRNTTTVALRIERMLTL